MTEEEEFQKSIKEFFETDDKITDLNKQLSALRNTRKTLEPLITEYMTKKSLTSVPTTKGQLSLRTIERKKAMNQEFILNKLQEKVEGGQASLLCNYLFDKIEKEETQILKRTNSKRFKPNPNPSPAQNPPLETN